MFSVFSRGVLAAQPVVFHPDELTFGFELTANTDQNPEYDIGKPIRGTVIDFPAKAAARFAALVSGEVLERTRLDEIPVRAPDGRIWRFENDGGILEVACPPLKFSELNLLSAVFQTFEDVGLKPEVLLGGKEGGGGHIHIGRLPFDQNPLLLRNFLVDVLNRPYLQGVLEEYGDDQSLSLRDRGLDAALTRQLKALDTRIASGESCTAEEVARAFVGAFGDGGEVRIPRGDEVYKWPARYSDINLANLLNGAVPTVEVRMLRAPVSAEQAAARALLFSRQLERLSRETKPIPFQTIDSHSLQWRTLPSVMKAEWDSFLRELGLEKTPLGEEWNSKFKAVYTQSLGRGRFLEVREGRSREEISGVYELKVVDFATRLGPRPVLRVQVGRHLFTPEFIPVAKGEWIARIEIPEKWSSWKEGVKHFRFAPEYCEQLFERRIAI